MLQKKSVRNLPVLITSFLFGLLILALPSCNDAPTSLGFPLDTINLEGISSDQNKLVLDSKSYQNRLLNTRNSSYFFVGKGNGMEAISFLRFGTLEYDSLDYIQETDIISAKISFYPSRNVFGDSLASINQEINLYELQKRYSDSTSWDSIINPTDGKNFYNSNEIISTFSGKVELKDTMNSVVFDIKKSLIAKWMQSARDTASISTYAPYKNGLVVVGGNGSKIINRFIVPTSDIPKIQVVFNNTKTSKVDTISLKLQINSFYANSDLPNDKSIVLQGVTSIRSQIFFDVSKIPQFASIVKAQLELTLDSSKSIISNFGLDSVLAAGEYTNLAESKPTVPYTAYRRANSSVYIFPSITSAIERWTRSDGKGSLILIPQKNAASSNELYFCDRLVFYGVDAVDISKRPKLTIIYSKRPKL
jgi:hypothetical protein